MTNIRLYEEKDYDYIYRALESEGLERKEITPGLNNTFIVDDGFFSYKIDGKYPRMIYFYIDKDKRSMKAARKLLKVFRQVIMESGYLFYILAASDKKPYMKQLIRYLKGVSYSEVNGNTYYYVPVFGRIKE